MIRFASFVFTLGILVPAASAVTYPLPPEGSRLVGVPITITVPEGNTLPLEAFAAQHGQGLSNMLEANPGWIRFYREPEHSLRYPSSLFCRQRCVRELW